MRKADDERSASADRRPTFIAEFIGATVILVSAAIFVLSFVTYNRHRKDLLASLNHAPSSEQRLTDAVRNALLDTRQPLALSVAHRHIQHSHVPNRANAPFHLFGNSLLLAAWLELFWSRSELETLNLNSYVAYDAQKNRLQGVSNISVDMLGRDLGSIDGEELNCLRQFLGIHALQAAKPCTRIDALPEPYKHMLSQRTKR